MCFVPFLQGSYRIKIISLSKFKAYHLLKMCCEECLSADFKTKKKYVCLSTTSDTKKGRSVGFFFFFLITSDVNSLHKTRVKHTFAIVFVVCHMYMLSVICIVSK